MKHILPNSLTFFLLFLSLKSFSQEIWHESFAVSQKGVWGDENSPTIHTDFTDITKWSLDYSGISVHDANDYAKTVATSGGRFECRDINGEVIWRSETIDISEYKNISIQLEARETGSGANTENKYLKSFFIVDRQQETLFEKRGENVGNWGKAVAKQGGINGSELQVVVYMNNHYASDKVILDEVKISGEEKNPVHVLPGDVLINEVLFNPVAGGEDFVEIYNRSEKAIPLNKLYLASHNKNLELTQISAVSPEKIIFDPQSYIALTKDTNAVFHWFSIHCPECFLQLEKFPSFNNDKDHVVLLNNEMQVVDEFHYDEKWHTPLLHNREGVSLERISFSAGTNEKENWHSASSEAGYGTPGYQNSQFGNEDLQTLAVSFEPEAFSPNNDGYKDFYTINFRVDKPGYMCNIWVYDSRGRMILKLADNQLLGTSDQIKWNGKNASGQRLQTAIYIVVVEIFNAEGIVKKYKDAVVLTDRVD